MLLLVHIDRLSTGTECNVNRKYGELTALTYVSAEIENVDW
jgi:hypothetical protein